MRNELTLLELRQDLNLDHFDDSSLFEQFQNQTLRPIIKLQHDLIIQLAHGYPHFKTLKPTADTKEDYHAKVLKFIQTQAPLKYQLIGLVIGFFTLNEFEKFVECSHEYSKRITAICAKRLTDTLYV
jgi:hypothetical protein